MIPLILSAVAGMWVAGRNRPATQVRKREIIGPRTGIVYQADDMSGSGVVILTVPGEGKATLLKRSQSPGFVIHMVSGSAKLVSAIKEDFNV
jgi:hypothetical protein